MADTGVLPILPAKTVRVLLVDNDTATQRLVESALCRTSYAVATEPDVVAAMKTVTSSSGSDWPVQMVLISFDRTEIHGFRLAGCLRAAGFAFPVVAMSATMSRERCLASGATHFLRKPINSADLLTLFAEHS